MTGGSDESGSPELIRHLRLAVVAGPARGLRWEGAVDRCSIGSSEGNDLRVLDPKVSRFHCEIAIESRGARVRDLDSRNGTILDGSRILDAFARDGSVLRLGDSQIRVDLGTVREVIPAVPTRFGALVGSAPAMRAAFAAMERAARTDATVLLEGESGTGKEEAARAIHQTSPRAEQPFVVVDCGAMARELLLSELFGHERGAFTGAHERRIGAFEEAGGGTLFLDEISELPLDLQPPLLRALERREIRRVGSNRYQPVALRVIAATGCDLRRQVNEERFRLDLYYRLAVVTVRLPPLRDRLHDLPLIAVSILGRLGADDAAIERLCQPELFATLSRFAWPGNVRELRNYLERCLVFERALPVAAEDDAPLAPAASTDASRPYAAARRIALDRFERDYIRDLLAKHGGRVMQAAAAAGIGRVQLWRLCRKHGQRP